MDPDVIEIDSSPEPSPTIKKTRKRKPQPKKIILGPVIELTSSEDDEPGTTKKIVNPEPGTTKKKIVNPKAGPSNSRREVQADPAPHGPSKNTPNGVGRPLFLPGAEEGEDEEGQEVEEPLMDRAELPPHPTRISKSPPPYAAPEPAPAPAAVPVNPLDTYHSQVLEIIPDVEHDHLRALIMQHHGRYGDQVVQAVLHLLFENAGYPRQPKRGVKRKAEEADGDGGGKRARVGEKAKAEEGEVDYANKEREHLGGRNYSRLALAQLQNDFPDLTPGDIKKTLEDESNGFYACAYLKLHDPAREREESGKGKSKARDLEEGESDEKELRRSRRKGKSAKLDPDTDPEFARELKWVQERGEGKGKDEGEDGEIECGCCFSSFSFSNIIQCPETHLFCIPCITTYSEHLLSSLSPDIVCIHQSSCNLPFPPSELKRVLPAKLWELYERVKQQKEVEDAQIEGLEGCPFCDWKCVIDDEQEKLFRCMNEEGGCGVVSCRGCKKLDHLPKSCKEVEEDKVLDGRHAIEEAMSMALMRNCPKCKRGFIKEHGCNKMTCPHCKTLSCYICREVITGYDHFNHLPAQAGSSVQGGKCPLWDSVDKVHADDVTKAAEEAKAKYKAEHPDVNDKDIEVELPPAPPPAPPGLPVLPGIGPLFQLPEIPRFPPPYPDRRQAQVLQRVAALQVELRNLQRRIRDRQRALRAHEARYRGQEIQVAALGRTRPTTRLSQQQRARQGVNIQPDNDHLVETQRMQQALLTLRQTMDAGRRDLVADQQREAAVHAEIFQLNVERERLRQAGLGAAHIGAMRARMDAAIQQNAQIANQLVHNLRPGLPPPQAPPAPAAPQVDYRAWMEDAIQQRAQIAYQPVHNLRPRLPPPQAPPAPVAPQVDYRAWVEDAIQQRAQIANQPVQNLRPRLPPPQAPPAPAVHQPAQNLLFRAPLPQAPPAPVHQPPRPRTRRQVGRNR